MKPFRPIIIIGIGAFLCLFLIRPCAQQPTQGTPVKPEGALRVKTDITGVQIFLDGQEVGTTPMTIRPVLQGKHHVALVKEGYEEHEQAVEIMADKTELLVVVMKPLVLPPPKLPATFRAIHQHILGYCIGTLTVTAEAIEYVDDQKKDVFKIPIRSLKSVTRSYGPMAGITPAAPNGPTTGMACRFESPDRAYGFWALKEGVSDKMDVVSEKTKELFQVVYRLWADTLKAPAKPGGKKD